MLECGRYLSCCMIEVLGVLGVLGIFVVLLMLLLVLLVLLSVFCASGRAGGGGELFVCVFKIAFG